MRSRTVLEYFWDENKKEIGKKKAFTNPFRIGGAVREGKLGAP